MSVCKIFVGLKKKPVSGGESRSRTRRGNVSQYGFFGLKMFDFYKTSFVLILIKINIKTLFAGLDYHKDPRWGPLRGIAPQSDSEVV